MNRILTSDHHKRLYLCASPSANFDTDGQSFVVLLCYESEGHLSSRIQTRRLCELVRTTALDYSSLYSSAYGLDILDIVTRFLASTIDFL